MANIVEYRNFILHENSIYCHIYNRYDEFCVACKTIEQAKKIIDDLYRWHFRATAKRKMKGRR